MSKYLATVFFAISIIFLTSTSVSAQVEIPENEIGYYFDKNGYFTVVSAIKNNEEFAVIPTISIEIHDGESVVSQSFDYVTVMPSEELPFKIKFPEVQNQNVVLGNIAVSFVPAKSEQSLDVEVIYDETLVIHDDGHLTGRIINKGNLPISNLKVFAIIHGTDGKILDMAQNYEMISKIEAGETRSFSMYPEAPIASDVNYYSCFAFGDESIIPMSTNRNGKEFNFRYDSGVWFTKPNYNADSNTLSFYFLNSWILEMYANFEFPVYDVEEKLSVFLNDNPLDFIQSIDEMGNWHVAFIVPPQAQGQLLITGFSSEDKTVDFNSAVNTLEKFIDLDSQSNLELSVFDSPLKQLHKGIKAESIVCKGNYELIFKPTGSPACVKPETMNTLIERGWIRIQS